MYARDNVGFGSDAGFEVLHTFSKKNAEGRFLSANERNVSWKCFGCDQIPY